MSSHPSKFTVSPFFSEVKSNPTIEKKQKTQREILKLSTQAGKNNPSKSEHDERVTNQQLQQYQQKIEKLELALQEKDKFNQHLFKENTDLFNRFKFFI